MNIKSSFVELVMQVKKDFQGEGIYALGLFFNEESRSLVLGLHYLFVRGSELRTSKIWPLSGSETGEQLREIFTILSKVKNDD